MDVVRGLTMSLDALCAADPSTLADGESIIALHREVARLQAVVTRATAAYDAGGSWAADGARSAAAWVAAKCGLPVGMARRRVRLGRDLRSMPATEAAWLAGDIGEAQVSPLAEARTDATAECFARDEAMLVDQAKGLPHRHFLRALHYWSQHADPDGTEDKAAAQHRARRLHLSCGFEGKWFLDGILDPISGHIVSRALKAIEEELFAADWAEAKARVGDGLCGADLSRNPAQRRADALVEMARKAMAVPAGTRLPEPLFTVLVGYETFAGRMCELADGRVVTPGSLVPWLDEAWVERVVFDGPDRVTNVSTRRRIFTGATRRSVEVRDRECFHPLCDATVEDCQVDHVEPWAVGGLTIDENGRLACAFHNRLRHKPRPPPPP
ncbi:MAG: hypothetical protein QOG43_32 [Actinomycetota bacterium]|jgi:hypothetical protein|nr:hypothetical protein [Actinomycetota bacterium]